MLFFLNQKGVLKAFEEQKVKIVNCTVISVRGQAGKEGHACNLLPLWGGFFPEFIRTLKVFLWAVFNAGAFLP